MNTKNIGNLIELSSINGYVHKIGTDTYFKKGIITDSVDNYEEVEDMPKYTREEYVKKVRELIKEKYSLEDEIAILANMNSPVAMSEDKAEEYRTEYLEYQSYRENCKVKAKELLSNG